MPRRDDGATTPGEGLVLAGRDLLGAICRPLCDELARCYWVIEGQGGPFQYDWYSDHEPLVEGLFLEVPGCKGLSEGCWRPGTLPHLAEHVVIDEWTCFLAFEAQGDAQAGERASRIAQLPAFGTEEFIGDLPALADLFLMHVDGWWEIYTPRPDWSRRLKAGLPEAFGRSAGLAGTAPDPTR